MTNALDPIERLRGSLCDIGDMAVAVSGGVDSMTLAFLAHELAEARISVYHAVSPAVPPEATERVQRYADARGWHLKLIDAGEFQDPQYRSNPVNRCYFCKKNLYGAIARATAPLPMVSGANLDDLSDYRPGLVAASERGVRHPFVEAGVDKATVREMARRYELDELAVLPAMPCLSSRIETGIRIEEATLVVVHRIETLARKILPEAQNIRCRVRPDKVTLEIDGAMLSGLSYSDRDALVSAVAAETKSWLPDKTVHVERYARGSAFIR